MNSGNQHQPQDHNSSNSSNSSNLSNSQHKTPKDQTNSSSLSIKLPSSDRQFNNGDEKDDEPTTPTSSDHRIPAPTTCPPAPRKPTSIPVSNKRKTTEIWRISVDLMVIIDAMVVPPERVAGDDILAGDLDAGDRVKKIKKTDVTIGS